MKHVKHLEENNVCHGGFSDVDFQQFCNAIINASEMFVTLHSNIYAGFNNDRGKFLRLVRDPFNDEETCLSVSRSPLSKESISCHLRKCHQNER